MYKGKAFADAIEHVQTSLHKLPPETVIKWSERLVISKDHWDKYFKVFRLIAQHNGDEELQQLVESWNIEDKNQLPLEVRWFLADIIYTGTNVLLFGPLQPEFAYDWSLQRFRQQAEQAGALEQLTRTDPGWNPERAVLAALKFVEVVLLSPEKLLLMHAVKRLSHVDNLDNIDRLELWFLKRQLACCMNEKNNPSRDLF